MIQGEKKNGDENDNKPELPRQFYPHHRHQERPLSSYPFLQLIGKRRHEIRELIYLRKARGSVNEDKYEKLEGGKLNEV